MYNLPHLYDKNYDGIGIVNGNSVNDTQISYCQKDTKTRERDGRCCEVWGWKYGANDDNVFYNDSVNILFDSRHNAQNFFDEGNLLRRFMYSK